VIMMCHGFISAHILDDSDRLFQARASQSRNRDTQRKWVAHLLLHWIDKRFRRWQAEGQVEDHIKSVIARGGYPPRFDTCWFESMLNTERWLKPTIKSTCLFKNCANWQRDQQMTSLR
jgi:hypothetical protein